MEQQTRDALERQKEAARYFEFAGVMMVVIDRNETVTQVNRKGCEILGYPEEEIIGENWFDRFVPEPIRADVRGAFGKLISGEIELVEYYENPILNRDGDERVIAWHNSVLRDDGGGIFGTLSSGSDVTERHRLTRELMEKESLARLGEMAAVVAHEVRNPLAGISGSLQNISSSLPKESPHVPVIGEILARVADLNDAMDDLLLYARPATPQLQPIRLLPLIQEAAAYLKRDPEMGETSVEVSGDSVAVMGDPKQLVPVFLNLLLNAAQALDGRGRIRVGVTAEGRMCRVLVRDSGSGIPEALRDRIFEPFFTTRSRGTGLGLATARRVIEAHGGDISVECPAEGGTTVHMTLALA